jgi:signal transduction histidine kinase
LAVNASNILGVKCTCDCDGEDFAIDPAHALHLYRIAQEAVTNAAQHGRAGKVRITLGVDGDRGVLRVEDDGGGFDPASLESKGLGLRIMRYRAQMMTGSLRIESTRHRGTTVSCWFPATLP